MKKIRLLLVAVMAAVVCVSGMAQQKKVAFVAAANPATDAMEVAILTTLTTAYDVTTIASTATLTAADFAAYDAVVLSPIPNSGAVPKALKGIDKPFVNLKAWMVIDSQWQLGFPCNIHTLQTVENGGLLSEVPTGPIVQDASHPVFAGLGATNGNLLELATGSKHTNLRLLCPITQWYGNLADNVTVLATLPANAAPYNYTFNGGATPPVLDPLPVIFEINTGVELTDNGNATITFNHKNIFIGLSEQTSGFTTEAFHNFAKNAVDYVLSGSGASDQAISADADVVNKEYFDITGKKVNADAKGFIIEKSYFEDGTASSKKLFAF